MLGFPIPYPNELVYSLISRARIHDGELSPKQLLDSVFENRKIIATMDLPSHIQCVADQYPESVGLDAEKLIRNHTLWPIYAPFIPPERRECIEKLMIEGSNGAVHLSSGMVASRIHTKKKLILCPDCVSEQKTINGEGYWDRRWQVPIVRCCPQHGSLIETNILFNGEHRHAFIPMSEAQQVNQMQVTDCDCRFSNMVYDLFSCLGRESPSYQQWSLFYKDLAIKYGFFVGSRIDHQQIKHQYCSYWTKDWLNQANLLPSNKDTSWLKGFFRKHRKSFSFAEHLTVIDAISEGELLISDAVEMALRYSTERKMRRNSLGTVTGCDSPDKKSWLSLLDNNSPKYARRQQPALYARLYRNNTDWLMQVNEVHHSVVANHNHRVNWGHRDRKAARELLNLCNQIDEDLTLPRMSKTYLVNHLFNSVSIEKNLFRLPRCRAILQRYAESIEEYQARRLARAMIMMRKRGQAVKQWSLLREAGLSDKRMAEGINRLLKEILKDEVGCEI